MPGGRPTEMTEAVLQQLRECFAVAATDEEACAIAGIAPSTLYNYQKAHPGFVEEKAALKQMPNFLARKNIVTRIQKGDVNQSNWWAEKKMKNEFSSKVETEHSGGVSIKWEE